MRPSLDRDQRRQALSKVVFGQQHRLSVMIAIADDPSGLVNPGDLAAELGFRQQSAVQTSFRDLEAAGLVRRQPEVVGRKVWYERVDSSAWVFAQELGTSVDRAEL